MELLESMIETEWGLDVTMKKYAIVDDISFIEIVKHVSQKCNEIEKKRILVDFTTFEQKVAFLKLFEAVNVSKQIVGPGLRLAFIAPHLVNNENSRFVENVGYNRAVDIEYFYDRETAKEWLLK